MNFETNRLNTFTNWPVSAPVDPIRIAKAGFFYTGEGTEVQCFSCGGKISQWSYGDQVMWRHRQLEPNCPFVLNPRLSQNVPLVLGQECPSIENPPTSITEGNIEEQNSEEPIDYGLTEEDEMYKSDALRLLSFLNWNDTSVSREALVNAGFYHAGEGRLRCAWCGGELAPFRRLGSLGPPLEVHRMYFPRCFHAAVLEANQSEVETSSQNSTPPFTPPIRSPVRDVTTEEQPLTGGAAHNAQLLLGTGTWRSLGVVGSSARHPGRASLSARLATFSDWPADRPQAPNALAAAGFFYTGTDDQVRCFYCDGGLGRWEAGDEPWSEHAHWFPHCGYVLLVKGQSWVDECRARLQRTVSADAGLTTRRQNPTINFPITDSQVDEEMEGSAALAALGAGLDAARVRRAIVRRLRATGVMFRSSEALIDAVLDGQLGEESWSTASPHSHLARDILANTLMEIVPSTSPHQRHAANSESPLSDHRGESSRSQSRSPRRSLTPVLPAALSQSRSPRRTMTPVLPTVNAEERPTSEMNNHSGLTNGEANGDTARVVSPVQEKKLSLEEENRQLKEARLCKVCMDSEVSVVFLPCGHLVSCAGCGAALPACPLCRANVRALVRAYLA